MTRYTYESTDSPNEPTTGVSDLVGQGHVPVTLYDTFDPKPELD